MKESESSCTITRNWLIAGFPIIVMLILTGTGLILHEGAEANHDLETDLVAMQANINKLNALEWQVIARGKLEKKIASEIIAVSKEIRRLNIMQSNNQAFKDVIIKYNSYEKYLFQEMAFLKNNNLVEAKRLNQLWVDPVFSSLQQEIDTAVNNQRMLAAKRTLFGHGGFVISFMFSAGTAILLYIKFDRQRLINKQADRDKSLKKEMARLERLNLIGEMAASIGHEIRNPMTTVRGFLQIMSVKKQFAAFEPEMNLMIQELDRANSIIKEYLNLASNKSVHLERNSINEIITTLYPLIKADAMLHDKKVILELGDVTELYLDEKEIRQLLLNLARNGLEAMSNGGSLKIKTWMNNNKAILSVSDQGRGIDSHLIDKLGTPFFTTKDDGTGLGLAVCYSIAARHQAAIRVETGSSGTVFHIEFNPANPEIQKAAGF